MRRTTRDLVAPAGRRGAPRLRPRRAPRARGRSRPASPATTVHRPGRSHRSEAWPGAPVAGTRARHESPETLDGAARAGRPRESRTRRSSSMPPVSPCSSRPAGVNAKSVSSGRNGPSTSIAPVTPRSRSCTRRPCSRARPGPGSGSTSSGPTWRPVTVRTARSLPLGRGGGGDEPVDELRGVGRVVVAGCGDPESPLALGEGPRRDVEGGGGDPGDALGAVVLEAHGDALGGVEPAQVDARRRAAACRGRRAG